MKKLFLIILLFVGVVFAKEINVAAAANLAYALGEIQKEFLLTHPQDKINISYSSSGKAYSQIAQGAPIDLFVSADNEFPQKLYAQDKTPQSPKVYAQGVLVLWSANPKIKVTSLNILTNNAITHIAIPNPELAPYGRAAKEALENTNLAQKIKSKIITASSISQAHQFVATGNAEVGFGALSLIHKDDKNVSYIIVDKSLYMPIEQSLVLTNYGKDNPLAKEFEDFILSPSAKAIFKKYGYVVNE